MLILMPSQPNTSSIVPEVVRLEPFIVVQSELGRLLLVPLLDVVFVNLELDVVVGDYEGVG